MRNQTTNNDPASAMRTIVEQELAENTFGALWKYTRVIMDFHVAGILSDITNSAHAPAQTTTIWNRLADLIPSGQGNPGYGLGARAFLTARRQPVYAR